MRQPVFWTVLAVLAGGALVARLAARRPLWPRHRTGLVAWEILLAGAAGLALAFHCMSMFFPSWVARPDLLGDLAAAVRALGATSQLTFWLPALAIVIALRRIWRPAWALLAVSLAGVGVTMFWSFGLTVHLAWITAAVLTMAAIGSGTLTAARTPQSAGA